LQQPGSLSRELYTDILAYVLKFNAFPAGATALDPRTEIQNGIRIVAFKPQAALSTATAQADAAEAGPNDAPNPYVTDAGFFKLPAGRTMGSSSAVAIDSRGHVWVADRCGANNCTDSPLEW